MKTLYSSNGQKFTAFTYAAGKWNGYWEADKANRVWVRASQLADRDLREKQGVVCK